MVIGGALMLLPFVVFLLLLYLGRGELGSRKLLTCVFIWLALLAGFFLTPIPGVLFVTVQSVFDIVLILMVFGSDLTIS